MRAYVTEQAPALASDQVTALARVAGGRLDRAERLLDPAAAQRRAALLEVAREVYRDPEFEPSRASARLLEGVKERGAEAKQAAEEAIAELELPARAAEQRARRAQFGAEREELLAALEELAAWYRDLVVVGRGRRRGRRSTSTASTSSTEDGTARAA